MKVVDVGFEGWIWDFAESPTGIGEEVPYEVMQRFWEAQRKHDAALREVKFYYYGGAKNKD